MSAEQEQKIGQAAVDIAQSTSISFRDFMRRATTDPSYPWAEQKWCRAGDKLEEAKHLAPAPQPPDPTPPPGVDLSLVQNVLILADDPWPALAAPPHYKFWITADLGYRHIYADGAFVAEARKQKRWIGSWCDCKAPGGDGTPAEEALRMAEDFHLDGASGEGEAAYAFQNGWDAGLRRFVVNLSSLNDAQKQLIGAGEGTVTVELYLNKQPGMVVNWENLNAGIGSNCGATYGSDSEGAVATPVDAYVNYPNAAYHSMSWYCGGSPKPDFARLP